MIIDLEFKQLLTNSLQSLQVVYEGQTTPPLITLADVLTAVYQAMHRRVTHVDWGDAA